MKKLFKKIWVYLALAASAVVGYLVFIKKQAIELAPRPDKFAGGDKPTKMPPKPARVDWSKKVSVDLGKVKKNIPSSRKDLIISINKKAKKKKK